ncbi:unnamed protein product, partial [marine sediment metagenome]
MRSDKLPEIPDEVLHRANQKWIWAEGEEFGHETLGKVLSPHRDRLRRVAREGRARSSYEIDETILSYIADEKNLESRDEALEVLSKKVNRRRGQKRVSKDWASISMTGLRAFAQVIEEWMRTEGHGWN